MADNTDPNGPLSLDAAVDILTKPLPPPRNTQQARGSTEADPATPDDDDQQDIEGGNADDLPTEKAPPDDDEGADADKAADQDEQTDDEDAAPDQDTQRQPEPSYDVQVDGKKSSVPVSELIKGYQRQQAFTQRSQALADERRDFEADRAAIRSERSTYSTLLNSLQKQITGQLGAEPDWAELQQRDPLSYSIEWARWNQAQQKLQAIDSEQRRLADEGGREHRKAMQGFITEQAAKLLAAVPEYKDAAVRTKDRDSLRDFVAETYGYTPEEFAQVVDHRAVLVMRDARAYRELQKRKPVVEKRVVETTQPLSRNRGQLTVGNTQQRVRAAEQRLSKSGSLRDAVELELQKSRLARRGNSNGDGSSG